MRNESLPILNNVAVYERVSAATRAVLEARANPPAYTRFLDDEAYTVLETVVNILLPQDSAGTDVDLAEAIDRRLAAGTNAGWRFATLPSDGEAYRAGLIALQKTLASTPMKSFEHMPPSAREAYLRCLADGEADDAARFPLSTFLIMLRTDVARIWMSHPSTMRALNLYSFADGATGLTDGPTANEGWVNLTANTTQAFEPGAESEERTA